MQNGVWWLHYQQHHAWAHTSRNPHRIANSEAWTPINPPCFLYHATHHFQLSQKTTYLLKRVELVTKTVTHTCSNTKKKGANMGFGDRNSWFISWPFPNPPPVIYGCNVFLIISNFNQCWTHKEWQTKLVPRHVGKSGVITKLLLITKNKTTNLHTFTLMNASNKHIQVSVSPQGPMGISQFLVGHVQVWH